MINNLRLMTFGPLIIRGSRWSHIHNQWLAKAHLFTTNSGLLYDDGLTTGTSILIGLLEVVGGFLLIVGLLTRVVALLFAIEMAGAFIIINISNAVILPKGYELGLLSIQILLMAISISLILTGPCRASIEWNIIKRELIPHGKDVTSI